MKAFFMSEVSEQDIRSGSSSCASAGVHKDLCVFPSGAALLCVLHEARLGEGDVFHGEAKEAKTGAGRRW